jgi:hypothetical protein
MISQNTHYYDNKLGGTKKEYEKILTAAKSTEIGKKMECISKLRGHLTPHATAKGLQFFDSIVRAPSYDPINQLNPLDLLYICYLLLLNEHIDKNDLLCVLNIQLEDMATGFCAQGQTIRLLQIIFSFGEQFLKT